MKLRTLLRLGVILSVIAAGLLVAGHLFFRRPLIESSQWKAVVEIRGQEPQPVIVYQMLGRPSRVFIRMPKEASEHYSWFVIDTTESVVAVPNGPRNSPYLYQTIGSALGVGLENPKIEDSWTITWESEEVRFSNGEITVSCRGN